MTLLEMALELRAAGPDQFCIRLRESGEWYAVAARIRPEYPDSIMTTQAAGETPEIAVANLYRKIRDSEM